MTKLKVRVLKKENKKDWKLEGQFCIFALILLIASQ